MKLYGISISNFYNVAKMALLEKGIQFEEVMVQPNQEESFLAKSPLGKIPVIETDGHFISESSAILTYLEKVKPDPALFPADAFEAALACQISDIIKLYIDAPARKLLGAAFFGGTATDEQKETAVTETARGVAGLARLTDLSGFIAGGNFSFADIYAFTTLPLPNLVFTTLGLENPIAKLPGYEGYMGRIGSRPAAEKVATDQKISMAMVMASKKG